jgi:hypothetical protein
LVFPNQGIPIQTLNYREMVCCLYKWKQCWTCGLIVGVYEAKPEVELDTLTEPRDNPFKFKSGQVETGESRKVDRSGRTQRKKKFKQDLEQYKEEDIKAALKKGAKLVSDQEN